LFANKTGTLDKGVLSPNERRSASVLGADPEILGLLCNVGIHVQLKLSIKYKSSAWLSFPVTPNCQQLRILHEYQRMAKAVELKKRAGESPIVAGASISLTKCSIPIKFCAFWNNIN